MSEPLVDMLVTLEYAAEIRSDRLQNPESHSVDETTEDDVIAALLREEIPPIEVLRRKKIYTRALRLMLKSCIDPQG
jgi:hypothetical protein